MGPSAASDRRGKGELADAFSTFLWNGSEADLRAFLAANSRLPGPRANLELASAFAAAVRDVGAEWRAVWTLCAGWTDTPPEDAPTNDPREFLVFCGARGIGALGAASPARAREALVLLRRLSRDPRWRVREAVAMAIQDLVAGQSRPVLRDLEDWVARGAWLEMRAVAAGLAEPRILRERSVAKAALRAHERILHWVRRSDDRSEEAFRVLRQCLGYSASVVVAAAPEDGFRWLAKLAATRDADVQWIVRENLRKGRLVGPFPGPVERVQAILRRVSSLQ